MLLLVAFLVITFCLEMGWVSKENVRWLLKSLGVTLAVSLVYRVLGALFYFVAHEPNGSIADYQLIFQNDALRETYMCIEVPALGRGLTGVFAFAAHGLGKVLFRQYSFAAEVLAFLCTSSAMALLLVRLQCLFGRKSGEEISFFVLCLPVGVFFFLPGSASLLLLAGALLFFFLGKFIPPRTVTIPHHLYSLLLVASSLGAAVTVYRLTTGF